MTNISEAVAADRVVELYERKAKLWSELRGRAPALEQAWLDRFTAGMTAGTILDLGAGNGWPIAAELLRRGFQVVGLDSSPTLMREAAASLPAGEWHVGDMRTLSTSRVFNGVLAWHSFFHLAPEDQKALFPQFAKLTAPGGRLMFTAGPRCGVSIGDWDGEPLYHASLDPEDYLALLAEHGFDLVDCALEDAECGGATVWLASRRLPPPATLA